MPRSDFKEVILHSRVTDRGLPILMLGNHISWWDGFLAQYINLEYFNRKVHIMMLEEQLVNRMFLNKTGAYSIKKGDRSAIESLDYTAELLGDPGNMVILFPQGKIHSLYDVPVNFETGWFRIFDKINGPVQVVFFIILIDYFSSRKPSLHIYLYDYDYRDRSLEDINRDFNASLLKSIDQQKSFA